MMRPLKVLTWNVHTGYLYYLSRSSGEFYLPFKPDRAGDYAGRWERIPWPDNVHEVPAEKVKDLQFDCVLFQLPRQYLA